MAWSKLFNLSNISYTTAIALATVSGGFPGARGHVADDRACDVLDAVAGRRCSSQSKTRLFNISFMRPILPKVVKRP
jgi:hypothetical protein